MLSDLDLNIAASTGIEDLNIADTAYDSIRNQVWAVDTEYGLIRLDLKLRKFVGVPVERLEGGLVAVCASVDGGAYGLTQRDGCVVKFDDALEETSDFAARGAFCIAATVDGVAAMFLRQGRLETARFDEAGTEIWRTAVQDVAGFPRGLRGTRLFATGDRTVVIAGDPKLNVVLMTQAGEITRRIDIDLPGGAGGEIVVADSPIQYPVGTRGREDYLVGSTVDVDGKTAALLYRSPARPDHRILVTAPLVDADAPVTAYVMQDDVDHIGGFDGERLLCIGSLSGRRHGRIFTIRPADLETIAVEDVLQKPSKPRWWEKYRLKFNVDSGFGRADEVEEGLDNYGGQDIRY